MTQTKNTVTGKEPCPQCRANGNDRSGDNLVRYSDGGSHCFACGLHSFGDGDGPVAPVIQQDAPTQWTPTVGEIAALPHRRIPEDICRLYNYRSATVGERGVEIASYYTDGKLVGQKIRVVKSKRFISRGQMSDAGMFGQHLWKHGGRKIVVTEGEIDCLSVATMFKGRWPVVSIPNGAEGSVAAFKRSLEFLSSYDEIVLCFDMDDPGQKYALECVKLLPPGKGKIVSLPRKDANEMLMHNESSILSTCIWEAKTYRPDGIVHAKEVMDRPTGDMKIWPFPWEAMNKSLYGQHGGAITMYTSGTGMGKSTLIRELIHAHLEAGRKVGVLMLEESPSETLYDLMSLHLKVPVRKIMAARKLNDALEKNGLPAIDFGVADTLTEDQLADAKGIMSERGLYLYDHHGENLADELLPKIEYMAVGIGVDVVVLDHISVVVADMDSGNERKDIDTLMTNLRGLVQRTGIHLDCVTQLRKADGKPYEEGGRITTQDLRGSASLGSVPNTVIAVERNQQHANPEHANTMIVRSLKDRFGGNTGIIMALRYDKAEGRLKEVPFYTDMDGEVQFGEPETTFKPEIPDESEVSARLG